MFTKNQFMFLTSASNDRSSMLGEYDEAIVQKFESDVEIFVEEKKNQMLLCPFLHYY